MSWRTLASTSRRTINKLNAILRFPVSATTRAIFPSSHHTRAFQLLSTSSFSTNIHSSSHTNALVDPKLLAPQNDDVEETTNEFLSRFVWIMRKKVKEAYPDSDKSTIDGMLLVIVERVVLEMEKGGVKTASSGDGDFSEDLWNTVWEVTNKVLEDMNKERKKERMKGFLQCEEVKEMCRFAGEVGIRGDLLRELRFKWAREKMEEHDFYEDLERMRKEEKIEESESDVNVSEEKEKEKEKVVELPKRRGKIRYNIYGLDLSDPKWTQVADRIHEAEQVFWPQEPEPLTGKAKLVTEKILSLKEGDDDDNLTTLLTEWVELVRPSRKEWTHFLDRLKKENHPLYLKVAEMVLTEDSFQTNVSDYSRLVGIYAKESRINDAERIVKKMNENGIQVDSPTASALVHMYCKGGNLERAKEAFEVLTSQGFQPDIKVYNSMILAFVNNGQPNLGEKLLREMEMKDVKPTGEIYMALLRSFSQRGDAKGANRISNTMQFAGFQLSLEMCTPLIEAHARASEPDPDEARSNFDYMIKLGHKPDDRCTASMIAVYEKKNLLDKALDLLLMLEKDGFEPGVATYSVLVDWLGKLLLVDEAEQLLAKIALQGEAPPFKVQVSLCDMYARAGNEKKVLQTLGILEARKDELGPAEFERIIHGLIDGGFRQDAQRIHKLMEAQGFNASDSLKFALLKPVRKTPSLR
ncbi:hypothetical protein VNO77_32681 [Canavalia gladiata]|uniref:Pentacotripeptide-repeat region of PRORP domain-containing protein n=1 Tax=Canavalia gladiata TaxID=3824 RepID=A0AAN9KQB7_CANGL